MPGVRMRHIVTRVLQLILLVLVVASPVRAQDPPPRIPWFVIDAHGSVPRFPSDDQELADSRDMELAELPGPRPRPAAGRARVSAPLARRSPSASAVSSR
jgi:hypothetical protein